MCYLWWVKEKLPLIALQTLPPGWIRRGVVPWPARDDRRVKAGSREEGRVFRAGATADHMRCLASVRASLPRVGGGE